ncbi:hypothetical protein CDL12_00797 [Handroanthus impetiginosus]|uniref:Uncharacterized protein n=1 Tax=Handroanthus impetiginosus TaxID=429701 RepID=A0A2G9I9M0_9LAMI|nr:hypothetical protein CDL12_00797 [Handroanthus impetiginosus]
MISSVGLEVMNSTNPELNWKTVTKGRRSRKSVARSLNGVAKVGNSTSPKRVGDFSGSDSDKSESVPIKKRRHLLQSPCRQPWTPPSFRGQDSGSPRTCSTTSPFSVDHEQLRHPTSSSCQKYSDWQLRGIDGSAEGRFGRGFDNVFLCDRTKHEEIDAGDFSGIELLAAAASMDDDVENANKEDCVVEDPLLSKNSDEPSSAKESKLGLKSNESENSLSNITEHVGIADCAVVANDSAAASQSLHHWDLNTPMDAWDEPYDDSVAGDASKAVSEDVRMEQRQNGSGEHLLSSPGVTKEESSNLKIEENKSKAVSPDRICSKPSSIKEYLLESARSSYSSAAMESSDQATAEDVDKESSIHVSSFDAQMDASNRGLSGTGTYEEEINPMPGPVAINHGEDFFSNVSEYERTAAADRVQTGTEDAIAHDMPATEISESVIDGPQKDTEVSKKTSELPGIMRSLKEIINSVTCGSLEDLCSKFYEYFRCSEQYLFSILIC